MTLMHLDAILSAAQDLFFSPADGITARWRISFDKVLNDYQISFAANVLLFVLPVLTTERPLVKLRVLE
jgi:hypothetical protein